MPSGKIMGDSQTNSESEKEVVPSSWADRNDNEAKEEGEIRDFEEDEEDSIATGDGFAEYFKNPVSSDDTQNGDASIEGVMNANPSQLDKLDGGVVASMHDGKYDEAISQTNHADKDHDREITLEVQKVEMVSHAVIPVDEELKSQLEV
ncbi:hypothetical protein K7X08_002752 [Anisodus acutangulus]|uniref:Uncharacterized protein n=1 Tax=Anisodus acutangulus TaxID=402998 RepID=A0A9Q1RHA5_9SOLA|nr:hypothetical protein K7X08_002752 [Anisodus acutangulus]